MRRTCCVTDLSKAVFLSYASQDAPAAEQLCEALRAAGIEVWFDRASCGAGTRGIVDPQADQGVCAVHPGHFAQYGRRDEGYFRLEWDLADHRSHMMAADRPFLLPVCIDDTRMMPTGAGAVSAGAVDAPARRGHTRRLRRACTAAAIGGAVTGADRNASPTARVPRPATRKPVLPCWRSKAVLFATIAVLVLALGYFVANRFVLSKRGAEVGAAAPAPSAPAGAAAFNPPPHSIAVLPFVNLSGDKEQEYFSDGLTEELLNSLAEINGLQVAARTSAFSFKGQDNDIGTIARKLNVGAVLEGSVRRSAHTIRITAQLINAVTGFHLWSKTYDRDLGDVLKLQTEIATAVAGALKVTLLGDVAAKVELGGTRNPAAFDAYLRGAKAFSSRHEVKDLPPRLPRTRKRFASIRTMRSRSQPDRSPLPRTPRKPRPQRRCVKALTRRKRMRARRLSWRRIWPRPTSHWRDVSELGTLDFRRRVRRTSAPSRSRRAMRRYCEEAAHLQPAWGTSMRALRPPAAPSCSTRSLATAIPCSAGRCMRPAAMRRRLRLLQKSSVLSPTSRRPTGNAGLAITGSGIFRARAPHAKRSRTTGRVNSASRWSMTSLGGTRMRKRSFRN